MIRFNLIWIIFFLSCRSLVTTYEDIESAIYYEDDVPDDEFDWIQKNEDESIDAEIAEGDSPVLAE